MAPFAAALRPPQLLGIRSAGNRNGSLRLLRFLVRCLRTTIRSVPNLGDMTRLFDNEIFLHSTIDVLVGGTPCQSFSTAGLRKGLADPRGNLALVYLRIADEKRPRWLIWENVPGVLSSNGGRDFGSFLGALGQLGYGFAYRVLDAQYFGVPQRRRRVFVVGYLGDWRPPAAVLFEREGTGGNCETFLNRKIGYNTARSWWDGRQVAPTLRAWDGKHPAMPANLPAIADCRKAAVDNTCRGGAFTGISRWLHRTLVLIASESQRLEIVWLCPLSNGLGAGLRKLNCAVPFNSTS